MPPPTTRHRFSLGGTRLYYERCGAGPPLLLVHGLSGSGTWWRRNVPAFAAHFSVYTLDLVGFGRSRRLLPLPLLAAADALAALIADLGHDRASVIGHSMGGQIAMLLAARHPACVDRLVLAAAAPGRPLMRMNIWQMMPLALLAGAQCPGFVPTVLRDALRAGPLGLWVAASELLAADTTSLLADIAAAPLLVWGERDPLVPLAVGEALQRALPGSRLVVLRGAGHVPMYDRPEAFNREVLAFLSA
jgi:pimeloyl-ACP methyl ester carboxylesterase